MLRLITRVLVVLSVLASPIQISAQSCPGEELRCNRCGYWECYSAPVLTYGLTLNVICHPSTNSCSGICINPQEVVIYWEAECDGQTYYGNGYTCCSY